MQFTGLPAKGILGDQPAGVTGLLLGTATDSPKARQPPTNWAQLYSPVVDTVHVCLGGPAAVGVLPGLQVATQLAHEPAASHRRGGHS